MRAWLPPAARTVATEAAGCGRVKVCTGSKAEDGGEADPAEFAVEGAPKDKLVAGEVVAAPSKSAWTKREPTGRFPSSVCTGYPAAPRLVMRKNSVLAPPAERAHGAVGEAGDAPGTVVGADGDGVVINFVRPLGSR